MLLDFIISEWNVKLSWPMVRCKPTLSHGRNNPEAKLRFVLQSCWIECSAWLLLLRGGCCVMRKQYIFAWNELFRCFSCRKWTSQTQNYGSERVRFCLLIFAWDFVSYTRTHYCMWCLRAIAAAARRPPDVAAQFLQKQKNVPAIKGALKSIFWLKTKKLGKIWKEHSPNFSFLPPAVFKIPLS